MQPDAYDILFTLADMPVAAEVRQEAVHVLQLLPTAPSIPADLRQALQAADADAFRHLRALIMGEGPGSWEAQPARLLYTLQVGSGDGGGGGGAGFKV